MKAVDEDRQRAEVFDALAHPTRIRILKVLQEEALSFAGLKKRMSIESSGHLQHHLGKLGDLIKTDEHGRYCLSELGRDALFTVQIVENATGFGVGKKHLIHKAYIIRPRMIWNVIIVSLAIASLISGFYILSTALSQGQYFCDVVKGTPVYAGAGVAYTFEIPVGHTVNYTAMVFSTLNPPNGSYYYNNSGTFEVFPPMVNSTYYRLGFLGFHIIAWASNFSVLYWGPVTGPDGWNEDQVINPYEAPPYETRPIESYPTWFSGGGQTADMYIIPITVFGNYTFRITNVGNTTIQAQYKVWSSTVTMETRRLGEDETFPAYSGVTDPTKERVVRIRRQPTPLQFEATLLVMGLPVTIAALSIYLINRKV